MIISTALEEDLATLVGLEEESFPQRERWSPASWAQELEQDHHVLVVREGGAEPIAAASFSCLDEDAELRRIVVRATERRKGLARRLLNVGAEWACALGARRMMLEVRSDNADALRLYRGAGFVPIARRAGYYGPGADALVMEAALCLPDRSSRLEWGGPDE